jgi:hypothetical protein
MTKAIYALLRAKFNCANEYGSNGACVCVLHDQTNITLDLFAMKRYHRVFARTLDSKTNWYWRVQWLFGRLSTESKPTTEYCVQEISGRRSITQARRCLRQRWILLSQEPFTHIQRIVSTIAIKYIYIYISAIVIPLFLRNYNHGSTVTCW